LCTLLLHSLRRCRAARRQQFADALALRYAAVAGGARLAPAAPVTAHNFFEGS
jgi:hypothetical protein